MALKAQLKDKAKTGLMVKFIGKRPFGSRVSVNRKPLCA